MPLKTISSIRQQTLESQAEEQAPSEAEKYYNNLRGRDPVKYSQLTGNHPADPWVSQAEKDANPARYSEEGRGGTDWDIDERKNVRQEQNRNFFIDEQLAGRPAPPPVSGVPRQNTPTPVEVTPPAQELPVEPGEDLGYDSRISTGREFTGRRDVGVSSGPISDEGKSFANKFDSTPVPGNSNIVTNDDGEEFEFA